MWKILKHGFFLPIFGPISCYNSLLPRTGPFIQVYSNVLCFVSIGLTFLPSVKWNNSFPKTTLNILEKIFTWWFQSMPRPRREIKTFGNSQTKSRQCSSRVSAIFLFQVCCHGLGSGRGLGFGCGRLFCDIGPGLLFDGFFQGSPWSFGCDGLFGCLCFGR